jgi:HlyD family secretion protein
MADTATNQAPSGAAMDRVVARPRWRRRVAIAGLALAAIAGSAFAAMRLSSGADRSLEVAGDRITTAEVSRGEFDDFIQIRGRFVPLRTIYIDTVQGGQVEAIHVDNGAVVERGQLLVELSNTQLQLEVISREAQITEQLNNLRGLELAHERNRLEQQRELVEVEYQVVRLTRLIERARELVESGATPRGQLEENRDELAYYKKRRTLLRESQGTVDRLEKGQLAQLRRAARQLEKNLTITRANLNGLEVRASAPGQLTAFTLEVGQSLAPGDRIGQIDDPSSYKILADIDEFYLGRVDIGQKAIYEAGGERYRLVVEKIRPQIANSRFQVDLTLEGAAPDKVRRGQTAQLRLQLGQPTKAVLVPNAAFYNDTGGAWVFVVSSDRTAAVRREVRLGRRNPEHIEVLEGLTPGEVIVTSPYTSFLEMDRLELTRREP